MRFKRSPVGMCAEVARAITRAGGRTGRGQTGNRCAA